MPTRRIVAAALAVLSLHAAAVAGAAPGPAGSLRVRACVTATALAGCATAALVDAATSSAAISAAGTTVYTTGSSGSTQGVLVAWARDRATGALTLRNCASYDLGTCIGAGGLYLPGQIAVGPHAVYVAGNQGTEVDEFPTAADGSLGAAASCVGSGSCNAPAATQYTALKSVSGVAVTPDGRTLAVTSRLGGLSIFPLDPTTGVIGARLACLSADTPLPNTCTSTPGLVALGAVVATNHAFYVASGDPTDAGIYEFDRDPIGGSVTGGLDTCVQETLTAVGVACLHGRGIPDVFKLVTSPDGQNLYGVDPETGTTGYLTTFALDLPTGHLTGEGSCFGNAGDANCAPEFGLGAPQRAAVFTGRPPDLRHVGDRQRRRDRRLHAQPVVRQPADALPGLHRRRRRRVRKLRPGPQQRRAGDHEPGRRRSRRRARRDHRRSAERRTGHAVARGRADVFAGGRVDDRRRRRGRPGRVVL